MGISMDLCKNPNLIMEYTLKFFNLILVFQFKTLKTKHTCLPHLDFRCCIFSTLYVSVHWILSCFDARDLMSLGLLSFALLSSSLLSEYYFQIKVLKDFLLTFFFSKPWAMNFKSASQYVKKVSWNLKTQIIWIKMPTHTIFARE